MPWGESPEKALFQNSQSQFGFWPQTSPTAEPITMVLEKGTFELHPEGRGFLSKLNLWPATDPWKVT